MKFVTDFHFHSKFSRAVSPQMTLSTFAEWGKKKGVDILTATDYTHPLWFTFLKKELVEIRPGVYRLQNKQKESERNYPVFILTTEISLIYQNHRIHLIIFSPNLETVEKINHILNNRGYNLSSDGRPILGTSPVDFIKIIKDINPEIFIIPAHIWTPWFSLYGSKSGYNSINDCFENFSPEISAIETGISSDPLMNWQITELDTRIIVSFSDTHSPKNLGREATVLELPQNFTYQDIITAFQTPYLKTIDNPKQPHVSLTIEFYPEEGKYHYTGHRKCNIRQEPEETEKLGATCPICGRMLTLGVAHRVKKLSRPKPIIPFKKMANGVQLYCHPQNIHHPFIRLVPLAEIIAEAEKTSANAKKTLEKYELAIVKLGSEIEILTKIDMEKIKSLMGKKIGEGIEKNRRGEIFIDPGYDGVYGKVKIWPEENFKTISPNPQTSLFDF